MSTRIRLSLVACLIAGGTILALALPGGSPAGDLLSCNGFPATIDGTPGDDVIYGTTHDDVIQALAGADEVHARAGKDKICGDTGKDTLFAGDDADKLRGDPGNDDLFGNRGSDNLDGGTQKGIGDNDLCDGGKPTRPRHPDNDPDFAQLSCERVRDARSIQK